VNRGAAVLLVTIGVITLAGCAAPPPNPGVGIWQLRDADAVDATTQSLDIEVMRLECSGGETGEVLEPDVTIEDDRILIRTDVAPLPEGAYGCPDNDWVGVTLELGEPLGDRELVDAACLDDRAAATVFCEDDGVRWRPSV
jgi:hypothetical protein